MAEYFLDKTAAQQRAYMREWSLTHAALTRVTFPQSFNGVWSPSDLQVLQAYAEKPAASLAAVSEYLVLDQGTVAACCKKLIAAKMLADEPYGEGEHGRRRRREVTRAGKALLNDVFREASIRYENWLTDRSVPGRHRP